MADVHNSAKRQPLLIAEKDIHNWINPGLDKNEMRELMIPCDDTQMAAYTIDRSAGNAKAVRDVP